MSSAFEGLPKTPNLKLNKPGYDNVADIEALNENADILDEEIQGIKNTFVKTVNGVTPTEGDVQVSTLHVTHSNEINFDLEHYSLVTSKDLHFNYRLINPPDGIDTIDAYDFHNGKGSSGGYANLIAKGFTVKGGEINNSIANSRTVICGGTESTNGADISLSGDDASSDPGVFKIRTGGETKKVLQGSTDGVLKWNNKNIVRSVNGVNADDTGNVISNPAGTIFAFAGNNIPSGYLPCNGGAISRTTYADLFAVIGTTYGAGDGSTTFNLPNLSDRFIQGSNTVGTVKSAGLPNIVGGVSVVTGGVNATSGAFTTNTNWTVEHINAPLHGQDNGLEFNAGLVNSIYGNSNTVQPPALTMRYIIKY